MFNQIIRSNLNHPLYNSRVLVVSGIGRSGTTVLRKSLEIHNEIISTQTENNLVFDLLESLERSINQRSNAIKDSIVDHKRVFKNTILDTTFPLVFDKRKVNALCCDLRVESLNQMIELFKEKLKIIYIIRNGIEVVASRMIKKQFSNFTFEENCRIWAYSEKVARHAVNLPQLHLVRHENFLSEHSLAKTYKRIFSHIGIAFEPKCIEFVNKNFCHPTSLSKNDEDKKNLNSRSARWNKFTEKQKEDFREICSDCMDYFGYQIPSL